MKNLFLLAFVIVAAKISAQELKADMEHALLKVEVLDNKKKPQANQYISFASLKEGKQYGGTTNAQGKFSILIPPAQKYKVKYKIFSKEQGDQILDMPSAAGPYTFEFTLTVTPPRTFTLDNVFFDSGKSTLRAESNKELNELAEYMGLKPSLIIEIGGHTDNVGAADANQKLSEDRANAVKEYLQKKGIAAERVRAKGYGDTKPVADNSTAAGKQKNRRTVVNIVSE